MGGLGEEGWVDVAGDGVHVHENGDGALVKDAVGRGDEGKGGGEDQVALLEASGDDAQVQAAGARVDAGGVGHACVGGHGLLEGVDARADAQVAGVEDLGDGLDFGGGQVGGRHGNAGLNHAPSL